MKAIYLLLIMSLLAGCSTAHYAKKQIGFINYSDTRYASKTEDATIDLFFEGLPEREYDIIGELQGYVIKDNKLHKMLKTRVRQIGGDGLIEIITGQDFVKVKPRLTMTIGSAKSGSSSKDTQVITVIGKVIKYKL